MSERLNQARKLAGHLAKMTEEQRQGIAAKMTAVCNPQGHFLTLLNTCLLWKQSQRTDITMVAGYKQWMRAGRMVQKGQHALGFIRVPMKYGKSKTGEGTDPYPYAGEPHKPTKIFFRFVPVFDVSQTEELEYAGKE